MDPDITGTTEFQNLIRTGYPDGGPTAQQEKLLEELQEEDKRLLRLIAEKDDAQTFLKELKFLNYDFILDIEEQYDKKIDIQKGQLERLRNRLQSSRRHY